VGVGNLNCNHPGKCAIDVQSSNGGWDGGGSNGGWGEGGFLRRLQRWYGEPAGNHESLIDDR
jgi:hypothetical protein